MLHACAQGPSPPLALQEPIQGPPPLAGQEAVALTEALSFTQALSFSKALSLAAPPQQASGAMALADRTTHVFAYPSTMRLSWPNNRRSPSPRKRSVSPRRDGGGERKPGTQLFVAGFNFICNERDVVRKFERYGRVNEVRSALKMMTRFFSLISSEWKTEPYPPFHALSL